MKIRISYTFENDSEATMVANQIAKTCEEVVPGSTKNLDMTKSVNIECKSKYAGMRVNSNKQYIELRASSHILLFGFEKARSIISYLKGIYKLLMLFPDTIKAKAKEIATEAKELIGNERTCRFIDYDSKEISINLETAVMLAFEEVNVEKPTFEQIRSAEIITDAAKDNAAAYILRVTDNENKKFEVGVNSLTGDVDYCHIIAGTKKVYTRPEIDDYKTTTICNE